MEMVVKQLLTLDLCIFFHFRRNHNDSMADEKSFMVGQSIANQRIEAWWSVLCKECSQFWMNLFCELKDNGDFSGSWMDKELIRFCFMKMIQVTQKYKQLQFSNTCCSVPQNIYSIHPPIYPIRPNLNVWTTWMTYLSQGFCKQIYDNLNLS